ncbi:MAG: ribose-phosphate diphosphokinase [Candidatus Gracilibacteria bacterium]|nr:ribose-phosphate diphosphokinase [Candidatus Gracilibacteria bacterium]
MKTIITHPNFDYLGDKIANDNVGRIIKAKVDFESFADGWPNIFVEKVKEIIEHKDVTYIGDFSNPRDLFFNYALINGVIDYYADKVRVIMPYFPVGTMERIDEKGEVATAKYFADIMSNIPSGRMGKTSIHVFDIHALQERFYFDSTKVNAEMHTAMHLLDEVIKGKVICFPDEGAKKRFGKEFSNYEKILLSKTRNIDERIISIKEGNPEGKDVVLIDDLIQTGGTLIKSTEELRSKGAKSVSAFATHGVFPNDSLSKLLGVVDDLLVTDSIPANITRASDKSNMQVLSLKSDIEKLILNG